MSISKKIILSIIIVILIITVSLSAYFFFYMSFNKIVLTNGEKQIEYYVPEKIVWKEEKENILNLVIILPQEERWSLRYWYYTPRLTESHSTIFLKFEDNLLIEAKSYITYIKNVDESNEKNESVFALKGTCVLQDNFLKNLHLFSIDNEGMENSVEYQIKKINIKEAETFENLESWYLENQSKEYLPEMYY
jgi:hypothetical protein